MVGHRHLRVLFGIKNYEVLAVGPDDTQDGVCAAVGHLQVGQSPQTAHKGVQLGHMVLVPEVERSIKNTVGSQ